MGMKTVIFFMWFLGICIFSVQGQDLVITTEGDTLNCKVTEKTETVLHFNIMRNGERYLTKIPLSHVVTYKKGYYVEKKKKNVAPKEKSEKREVTDNLRTRLALDLGIGHFTQGANFGALSSEEFFDITGNGINLQLRAQRYWGKHFGAGVTYSLFRYSDSADDLYDFQLGKVDMDQKIFLHVITPTFNVNLPLRNRKHSFVLELGLGYVGYKEKLTLNKVNIDGNGGAFNTSFAVSYEYEFSRNLAVGVQLSESYATLDKMKYQSGGEHMTLKLNDSEGDILLVSFSVGLRFRGKK